MRAFGFLLAGSLVAVIGCRPHGRERVDREGRGSGSQQPEPEDPCKDTAPGDLCSEELPVANPVTLPDGRVRVVFEERDPKDVRARCRVVDFTRSGQVTVATGCCERGNVVATALDENDRFYVLCREGLLLEETRLVARRLEADRTFHDSSPVTALVPADFGLDVDPQSIPRHHLIVANGSTWLVHDLSIDTGAKDRSDLSYVQPMRGPKPFSMDARFAAAYVSNGALFAISAYGDSDRVTYRFYRVDADRVAQLDEPAGVADARCEAWHGTAVDGAGPLELRVMQYDEATHSERPVAIHVPHGRALPSATSRGSGPALCNGQWSRFTAPLAIGSRALAAGALAATEASSCTASGCVLVYVSESEPGGDRRFHVHRVSAGGT